MARVYGESKIRLVRAKLGRLRREIKGVTEQVRKSGEQQPPLPGLEEIHEKISEKRIQQATRGKRVWITKLERQLAGLEKVREHAIRLRRDLATDPLTQLGSVTHFNAVLPREAHEARAKDYDVAVVFYDLDNFKSVNDTLGHERGDQVIKAFAEWLAKTHRESDHLIRRGGDEFIVVYPRTNSKRAMVPAEMVADAFTKWVKNQEDLRKLKLGVSYGVAHVNSPTVRELREAVKTAENEMRKMKKEKRAER